MRIRLLGPMSLAGPDGQTVDLKGERLRTLLVALALNDGRPVSVGALAETLWPDEPPANPANAVQALASRLRAALGRDAVELTPAGYRLTPDTDLARFSRLLRSGEHRAALGLWRGEPDLPGHPDEVQRLLSLRQSAEDEAVEADLAAGNGEPHIPALRAAVAADPLRERPRAQLLRALHQAGRDTEALAEYERARAVLAQELGADPSRLLREAHLAVLAGPAAPSAGPEAAVQHGLPAALTSFLGRDAEVTAVRADLTGSRLVTLIGPGGAGKTRLAVESARSHPTPLRLVELAPVKDAADLPGAVAATLHRREATAARTLPGAARRGRVLRRADRRRGAPGLRRSGAASGRPGTCGVPARLRPRPARRAGPLLPRRGREQRGGTRRPRRGGLRTGLCAGPLDPASGVARPARRG